MFAPSTKKGGGMNILLNVKSEKQKGREEETVEEREKKNCSNLALSHS